MSVLAVVVLVNVPEGEKFGHVDVWADDDCGPLEVLAVETHTDPAAVLPPETLAQYSLPS